MTSDDGDDFVRRFESLNARRLELAERKFHGGLNALEEAELKGLKEMVHKHMRRIDPRGTEALDALESQIDEQLAMLRVLRALPDTEANARTPLTKASPGPP